MLPNAPPLRRQSGLSLAELWVTLALFGLIAAAAVPAALGTLRTFHLNGAAREILAQVRHAQQLSVTRRGVHAFHWRGAPAINGSTSEYRIVRDAGTCNLPAESAAEDGTNVIQGWHDLQDDYGTVTIEAITDSANNSLSGIMFDTLGASLHPCGAVTFPVEIIVVDSGGRTRTIEVAAAGSTRLL